MEQQRRVLAEAAVRSSTWAGRGGRRPRGRRVLVLTHGGSACVRAHAPRKKGSAVCYGACQAMLAVGGRCQPRGTRVMFVLKKRGRALPAPQAAASGSHQPAAPQRESLFHSTHMKTGGGDGGFSERDSGPAAQPGAAGAHTKLGRRQHAGGRAGGKPHLLAARPKQQQTKARWPARTKACAASTKRGRAGGQPHLLAAHPQEAACSLRRGGAARRRAGAPGAGGAHDYACARARRS